MDASHSEDSNATHGEMGVSTEATTHRSWSRFFDRMHKFVPGAVWQKGALARDEVLAMHYKCCSKIFVSALFLAATVLLWL
jgi:hypothetical protein